MHIHSPKIVVWAISERLFQELIVGVLVSNDALVLVVEAENRRAAERSRAQEPVEWGALALRPRVRAGERPLAVRAAERSRRTREAVRLVDRTAVLA